MTALSFCHLIADLGAIDIFFLAEWTMYRKKTYDSTILAVKVEPFFTAQNKKNQEF